jgi:hypothetical protein
VNGKAAPLPNGTATEEPEVNSTNRRQNTSTAGAFVPSTPDGAPTGGAKFAKIPHWVLLADVPPRAVVLYGVLVEHVNRDPENPMCGRAWPSQDTLADLLGISRRQTVQALVSELERIGACQADVVRAKNGSRKTYYRVFAEPPNSYQGRVSMFAEPHMDTEILVDTETMCGKPNMAMSGKPHIAMFGKTHVAMCGSAHINQTELITRQSEVDGENQTELSEGAPAARRHDDKPAPSPGRPSPPSVVPEGRGKDEGQSATPQPPPPAAGPSAPTSPAEKRQEALKAACAARDAAECGQRAHDVLRGRRNADTATVNRPEFLATLYGSAMMGDGRATARLHALRLYVPHGWLDVEAVPA